LDNSPLLIAAVQYEKLANKIVMFLTANHGLYLIFTQFSQDLTPQPAKVQWLASLQARA